MFLWCPCQAKKIGTLSTSPERWRGGPQFQIIRGYAEVKTGAIDPKDAVRWLTMAATHGHPKAATRMGMWAGAAGPF